MTGIPRSYLRSDLHAKADPKGRFVLATKNLPSRVLHLADQVEAVWVRPWPRGTLKFERFAALAKCSRSLRSVSLHIAPPDGFELCGYCLAAELGLEITSTATKVLAGIGEGVLDVVEQQIGAPVPTAARRAHLGVVA